MTAAARRLLASLAVVALMSVALVIAGSGMSERSGTPLPPATNGEDELVARGAELYAFNCAVCHGREGGGLSEAKLAFPEDHRACTRCHRPNNRVVQPLTQPFIDNDMFSIGDPPPLHGPSGLAAQAAPVALMAYVSATMPRYDPGRLSADEYRAVTAHLLVINGRVDEVGTLLGGTVQGGAD